MVVDTVIFLKKKHKNVSISKAVSVYIQNIIPPSLVYYAV